MRSAAICEDDKEAAMLKDYVKSVQPDDEALKSALKDERAKLFGYQMRLKEARLPVMVIF